LTVIFVTRLPVWEQVTYSSCVSGRCAKAAVPLQLFPNVHLTLGWHPQLECTQGSKEQQVPAADGCLQSLRWWALVRWKCPGAN